MLALDSLTLFLERFGQMMSRLVLTLVYFLVLGPFALVYRVVADPLHRRRPRAKDSAHTVATNWTTWDRPEENLGRARRQD